MTGRAAPLEAPGRRPRLHSGVSRRAPGPSGSRAGPMGRSDHQGLTSFSNQVRRLACTFQLSFRVCLRRRQRGQRPRRVNALGKFRPQVRWGHTPRPDRLLPQRCLVVKDGGRGIFRRLVVASGLFVAATFLQSALRRAARCLCRLRHGLRDTPGRQRRALCLWRGQAG